MNVIEAGGLGKRYGGTWALRDCSLAIPSGHVAALVGPNGAGKSTLLNLAVGLAAPSAGGITVLNGRPPGSHAALDGIAFVAQDTPLYKNLSVVDMLHLTRNLNRHFDRASAEARLAELGIPLKRKAGRLSGGQQAQLALTLALARRPRLLVLDEPMAMLDPIARHDFMASVLTAAADDGMSVLLSSHVLAELERVADYLIVLSQGRVQVTGEVDDLLASHRMLTGPAAEADQYAERPVVHVRRASAQAHLLVRATAHDPVPPGWETHPVGLEELALAYLREPGATALPGPAAVGTQHRRRFRDDRTRHVDRARPREENASLPPLPWRRMAWINWRQHRIALGSTAAFLGALAAYLWLAGLQLHHAYAAVTTCHPAGSLVCANLSSDFVRTHDHTATIIPGLLQVVPALIGAFVGAPVLARELETGTFRYAWTQGFGRRRWTLAKLVPLAIAVAAAAGVFSMLFSWYYRPFIADGQSGPFTSIVFDLRGIAFAAWTLTAFAIGALAGVLIRRVVPAIVATLAVYTGLAVVAANLLRRHYVTPLVTNRLNVPVSAWIYRQWWTKGGTFAFSGRPPVTLLQQLCPPSAVGAGKPVLGNVAGLSATKVAKATLAQCISRHGYVQWTRYQPVSRVWQFQWIEGAWLLALSALLIALTVRVVQRRAA